MEINRMKLFTQPQCEAASAISAICIELDDGADLDTIINILKDFGFIKGED